MSFVQLIGLVLFSNFIASSAAQHPYVFQKPNDDIETVCPQTVTAPHLRVPDYHFDSYLELEQIYEYMDYLSKESDRIKIITIGETYQKRPIKVMKIDYYGECTKKIVAVEGGLRPKSKASIHIVLYLMTQLVKSTVPDVHYLAKKYIWYLLPVANPDGYVFTANYSCHETNMNEHGGCVGVDLTGNFPYNWVYLARKTCKDRYYGPYPSSESETRAWVTFLEKMDSPTEPLFAYFNLLTYGSRLRCYNPTGDSKLCRFAEEAAKAMTAVHNHEFKVQGFHVDEGASFEWARYRFNKTIELVYSYEVRGNGSNLPTEQIILAGEEILASIQTLIFQAEPPESEYPLTFI